MAPSTRLLLVALTCTLLNGCVSVLAQEFQSNSSQNIPRDMTNGERLSRGLPLKKPQFHRREKRGHTSAVYAAAAQTSSSAAPASTSTAASGCDLVSGTVKVTSTDGSLNGYVSSPNEEGLYGYCEDASKAVTFTYNPCGANPIEITGEPVVSNGTSYELLGCVEDSRSGCFLVGNVPHTDAQCAPKALPNPLADARGFESSSVASTIWNITSDSLTAYMVESTSNTSSLTPFTYSTSTGLFALNGDGSCPGTNATFSFVAA